MIRLSLKFKRPKQSMQLFIMFTRNWEKKNESQTKHFLLLITSMNHVPRENFLIFFSSLHSFLADIYILVSAVITSSGAAIIQCEQIQLFQCNVLHISEQTTFILFHSKTSFNSNSLQVYSQNVCVFVLWGNAEIFKGQLAVANFKQIKFRCKSKEKKSIPCNWPEITWN